MSMLVVAAQAGDRRALEDLMSTHLPLVYSIVRRAVGDDPDADDVVQEVVLRALRELRELRAPESFRAWLVAIAVHQLSTHLHRQHRAGSRAAPLDALVDVPDAAAEVEPFAVLRLDLAGQRREVGRASRWLDADDRALLSLWRLEVGDQLSRAELAQALKISPAHAGVRVQRMRFQLDISRSVVAALEARPRCRRLESVITEWDGQPGPTWRKRIARHIRSCAMCTGAAGGRVPAERLLAGAALLPVPAILADAVLGKLRVHGASTTVVGSVQPGAFHQLVQAVVAHPVAAACLAATLAAGLVMATTNWPGSLPWESTTATGATAGRPDRSVRPLSPTPSPTVAALAFGPVSLEAANETGFFVSTTNSVAFLVAADPRSDSQTRQRATFEAVAGLAATGCFSFRLPDGQYLRHASWRLRTFRDDGSVLFRGDATFCQRPGLLPGSVSLESYNYPGWFLRHRGEELWVDNLAPTADFAADTSFMIRKALG